MPSHAAAIRAAIGIERATTCQAMLPPQAQLMISTKAPRAERTAAKLPETTVQSLYPQHCTHGFVLGCSYMRNGCPQWATMSFQ